MIRNGRTVLLGDEFVRELELTEQYVGRTSSRRGREFVSMVLDFLFENLAPLPFAYPAHSFPAAPLLQLRRAVFRKEYVIIYEVTDEAVSFVFFHHTSRQPELDFLQP